MKIIKGLSQSNLFLDTIRNSIDTKASDHSTKNTLSLSDSILKLMNKIKSEGDAAIKEITLKLDNVKLDKIEVDSKKITDAFDKTDKNLIDSLIAASKRITNYHTKTLPKTWTDEQE